MHAEQDNDDCPHATSTGSGTPCGVVAVTGLLLCAGGRHRWLCCLVSAGGRRGFSSHIGDGRSGFGRGGGHQATFIARNGGGDSWNFPTLGHMGKKRRQGRLRPVGAESRRRERNSGRWSTGRQPTTWTTGAVREACAGSTWTRIGRSRHARLAQRLRQGGLSGNVETRRRADSKKLEMANLKKAAAPLATHMRRLRGVRPENEAPHVPESVGAEVPNDSRLQRQTRLQHRHRLAELLAAVWARSSISQTSAGKRMTASHRWRRRKSAPAKDTPLSSSPRGTGNGTENGRGKGSVITVHPAHLPVGLGVKTELSPLIPR